MSRIVFLLGATVFTVNIPVYAASINPGTEGSAVGLLVAGVLLVGIGRFRPRKR